jgi:putative transposase
MVGMPRTARASVGGICYHVINCGNARAEVFHKDGDYEAFVDLMAAACRRLPMRVPGYCLMPNHFHLVLWPRVDGDLSRWMQWLMTSHVRRYHGHYRSSGHVWQGRFKAFPIQQNAHLLTVLRYVERNPLRAGLVERAQDWAWSSLRWQGKRGRIHAPEFLSDGPVERGANWSTTVNRPMTDEELLAVRTSVNRGSPWRDPNRQGRTAARLGLEASLRPRGRPRSKDEK